MQSIASFSASMQDVAKRLKDYRAKECMIIHHDEADGICSGTICRKMLERYGYSPKNLCLDKLFPEIIKDLHGKKDNLYVYADMGSAHAQLISSLNASRNLVIILDHHDPSKPTDPMVHNINPEFHGMSGESDASASTVAYSFAKTLDKANEELAYLAIIGTAEIPRSIKGLNRNALGDAIKNKQVEIKKTKTGEDVRVNLFGKSYKRVSTMLSILGSVGYYRNGPEIGMKMCLEGFDDKVTMIDELEEERKEANRRMLDELRQNGLNQLTNIQWFHAHDNYRNMSGKVIGSFCSYLRFQSIVRPLKYLIGIMNIPREIPGYGKLCREYVKVSSRVPEKLARLIEKGKKPSLAEILPEACRKFDGFGDGHSIAASGVIVKESEEEFVRELDALAGKDLSAGKLNTFLQA